MELRQLKTFVTIAEVYSFVKAGKILNYSQPTMTTHIQSLENELNYKLFQRLGHEVALTAEGKHFLLYANKIINLCQEATQCIEGNTVTGKLIIGTSEAFGILRLPSIIKEFRSCCPDVSLEIKFKYMDELIEDIKKNEIDLAFVLCEKVNHPNLTAEIFICEPLALVAAPENPLVQKERITLSDISEENLILTQRGCSYRAAFEELLKKEAIPPVIMGVNNLQAIKEYTKANLGITILPYIYVEKELNAGSLRKLLWYKIPINMSSQLVYHKDKWHSNAMTAFLKIAHKYKDTLE